MTTPLTISLDQNGALLTLRLNRPKGNIVDAEMIAALTDALTKHCDAPDLKGVLLSHAGPHFSFGASVEEHLPETCAAMLASLHALINQMLTYPVPILVAARGQCLGGGLEVALAGTRIFAHRAANLGQPEMMLGVFAPAASCLMPARTGLANANDLLWSGRSVTGVEALAMGLVDEISDTPEEAALAYFKTHYAPKSASSLRLAVRALNADYARDMAAKLQAAEDLYLNELMSTRDALEGLNAFLARRKAKWENR